MYFDNKILMGKTEGGKDVYIYPKMANRHGLIAGATGTGKTVSLKVMAESFADAGVPVFLADAKGDLSGMCQEGVLSEDMQKRIDYFGLNEKGFNFKKYSVNFWDVYGERGIRLRTTISEMGPILLSRIMNLNDTQSDILNIVFKIADDNGLLLIDTKDLKSMLQYVIENADELSASYGALPESSLNVIIRAVVSLDAIGGEDFFAEPALNIKDWLCLDANGRGFIQVLECEKLMLNPKMYSMFLLWMISELYETLPEAGDLEKPRMVFFFDEAHMLFDSAPAVLLEKIEQVVKLIRSKGVGIYFITQNPKDIPNGVLSQLGNKIQHALRAYTPAEQKSLKAVAEGFRVNPEFDTLDALGELGTGEALISVLDEEGIPTIVERAKVLPPSSKMGAIDASELELKIQESYLYGKYNYYVDNESAYERLTRLKEEEVAKQNERLAAEEAERKRLMEEEEARKAEEAAKKAEEKAEAEARKAEEKAKAQEEKEAQKAAEKAEREAQKAAEKAEREAQKAAEKAEREAQKEAERLAKAEEKAKEAKSKAVKKAAKSVASTTAGSIGRELGKGLGKNVGGSFGKTLGGNVGASLARGIVGTLFK